MTTFTPSPVAAPPRPSGRTRAISVGSWAVRGLLSAQFAVGGVFKLNADPTMVVMFDQIGAGQWLRLLVGVCEIAGAVGLLTPRLAGPAAAGLLLLMVGAAVTNVVVLSTSPGLPLVLGVLAAAVLVARRPQGGRR